MKKDETKALKKIVVGTRVLFRSRKGQERLGRIAKLEENFSSRTSTRPFSTLVTVEWDDPNEFASSGSLGWIRTYFREVGEGK